MLIHMPAMVHKHKIQLKVHKNNRMDLDLPLNSDYNNNIGLSIQWTTLQLSILSHNQQKDRLWWKKIQQVSRNIQVDYRNM